MWSTPPLPLLHGLLKHGLVVPIREAPIGKTELFNHLIYLKPFEYVQTNESY